MLKTQRNLIYAILLFVIAISFPIELSLEAGRAYATGKAINILFAIIVIALVVTWQSFDAEELNTRQTTANKVITILVIPIGSAIHMVQTRGWMGGICAFILFWSGIALTIFGAILVTDALS